MLFGKKNEQKKEKSQAEIESYVKTARQLAESDEKARAFLEARPEIKKEEYVTTVNWVGSGDFLRHIGDHYHPEVREYAEYPDRLMCVGLLPPEKERTKDWEAMRLYVDVESKRVVARDILTWDTPAGQGRPKKFVKV